MNHVTFLIEIDDSEQINPELRFGVDMLHFDDLTAKSYKLHEFLSDGSFDLKIR